MPIMNQGGFMGPPGGMPGPLPPDPRMLPPVTQIDPTKEIWVETVSPNGKVYFYHAKTRQSVWKRPTGDNIQVIQQSEV